MSILTTARTGFDTLRSGGLNWDSFPLRLFDKGNASSGIRGRRLQRGTRRTGWR